MNEISIIIESSQLCSCSLFLKQLELVLPHVLLSDKLLRHCPIHLSLFSAAGHPSYICLAMHIYLFMQTHSSKFLSLHMHICSKMMQTQSSRSSVIQPTLVEFQDPCIQPNSICKLKCHISIACNCSPTARVEF